MLVIVMPRNIESDEGLVRIKRQGAYGMDHVHVSMLSIRVFAYIFAKSHDLLPWQQIVHYLRHIALLRFFSFF